MIGRYLGREAMLGSRAYDNGCPVSSRVAKNKDCD